jgi:hypothetical protein
LSADETQAYLKNSADQLGLILTALTLEAKAAWIILPMIERWD